MMTNGRDERALPASMPPAERDPLVLSEPRIKAATLRRRLISARPDVPAIRVEHARVEGALNLAGIEVSTPLTFHDCEFDGELSIYGALLESLELSRCKLVSLNAENLVTLGALTLRDTALQADLLVTGAKLRGSDDALVVEHVSVLKDMDCQHLRTTGHVRFTGAQIGGTLNFDSADLGGGVYLHEVRADTIVLPAYARTDVDLSGSQVRLLRDQAQHRRLTLSNFSFDELEPLEAESRLNWLEHAHGADMETYRRLAMALRRVGRASEADWVMVRGERITYKRSGAVDRLGGKEVLKVPSDQHAARESLTGLLPSAVILMAMSAVVYGAFEVLPRLDDLRPSGPTTWSGVIGWLGLIVIVLTTVFALLPLFRAFLIRVSWLSQRPPSGNLLWRIALPAVALSRAADRIDRRYGLDARYGWPRLAALLPDDARKVLEDTQRQLDILLAAPPGFIGAAAVTGLFGPYFSAVPALAIAPVAMLTLAFVTIIRAGSAAADHGRAVEAAVDLHRFRLLEALHIPLPEDPARERELFERVSLSFIRAEPYAGAYLHPSQAEAGLGDVARTLENVVVQKVTEAIEGAPLVNFSGHVSVRILQAGNHLPITFKGDQVDLVPGEEYVIEVTIGPDAIPQSRSDLIEIVNGIKAPQVPFDVSLDADTLELSTPERPLIVPENGANRETFDVRLHPGASEQSVWVRVSQRGRLSQLVALRLCPRGMAE